MWTRLPAEMVSRRKVHPVGVVIVPAPLNPNSMIPRFPETRDAGSETVCVPVNALSCEVFVLTMEGKKTALTVTVSTFEKADCAVRVPPE